MSKNRERNTSGGKPYQWKISLFGGMRIVYNGKPISPPPYRTYGLLTFLLLKERLPIRRERLGGLLFGDLPREKARGRISDYIWQIKKYLPGFPLTTSIENVGLDRQFIWVDVNAFRDEVNKPNDPLNERFLDLYQGDLLPELYDEWVLVERERWRSYYLRGLRVLINNLLDAKKIDKALLRMERLLREEPYDEEIFRLLMQTYAMIGRRGAALAAYEKFYILSTEQIGLEPDGKTIDIYESIKSHAAATQHVLLEDHPIQIISTELDDILREAQSALEQGNRVGFKRLFISLPMNLSPAQTILARSLKFNEKLYWGELDQAERLLGQCDENSPSFKLQHARLAFARHDHMEAKALAEALLDEVHQFGQPVLEANALLVLSMANAEMGETKGALGVLDRAISLVRKTDNYQIRVQAYIQKGRYWRLKGAEESASDTFKQALSLARSHNLRLLMVEILNELGTNSNYYGRYQDALKYLLESLEIARDLGLSGREASILVTLSATFDFLGRHTETADALKSASRIYEEKHDSFGLAKCHYNLAYSLMNAKMEDVSGAIEYAEKAMKFFLDTNNLGWQASTHTALGYFHCLAGHADRSIENLDAAIRIHTELDEFLFIPENHAYKGLAYIQKGHPKQGLEFTQFAIKELIRLNISDIVAEIYYAHACVVLALGNEREARKYIRLGYETYLEFASEITDDNARIAYFERDPITRRLMKMAYEFGIAPKPQKRVITRELPGVDRYKLKLELTADAGPADQALGAAQGLTALRQARLKRILKETDVHGGRLTTKELAELFHVSPRTIHRDLKEIEKESIHGS